MLIEKKFLILLSLKWCETIRPTKLLHVAIIYGIFNLSFGGHEKIKGLRSVIYLNFTIIGEHWTG